jgi:hypothetical protein
MPLDKERWAENQAPTNPSCPVDDELLGRRMARELVTEACLRDLVELRPVPVCGLSYQKDSARARD